MDQTDVKVIKNIFSLDKIEDILQVVANDSSNQIAMDDNKFHRKMIKNNSLMSRLHKGLLKIIVEESIKKEIVPSLNFLSYYKEGKGKSPVHIDREDCVYTLSLCMEQTSIWPLKISEFGYNQDELNYPLTISKIMKNFISYSTEVGDGIIFNGFRYPHWRDQLHKGNKSTIALFHYFPK